MSKSVVTESIFIPPPLDGLNLIAGPADYKLTEARKLDWYRVFDFGIRQVGKPIRSITDVSKIGTMFSYTQSASTTERMLFVTNNKVWRLDNPTDASATDITGAVVITSDQFFGTCHNKRLFFFNGTDTPFVHDLGTGNVTAFSASGPTLANLAQGTSFNHRLYIVEKQSTIIWYGGVDAISGTFTSLDVGAVFKSPGYVSFVASWTFNQGSANEDFFVIVSSLGEVLLYSGYYPDASNWQLIGRARIPAPVFAPLTQPYTTIGTELYVATKRGLVALSGAFTGLPKPDPYETISRKIKDSTLTSIAPTADRNNPFLYVANNLGSGVGDVYCHNYERGAWSRLPMGDLTSNSIIYSMAVFGDYLMIGTGTPDFSIWYVHAYAGEAAASTHGTALTYKWSTPFFDFGNHDQKQSKMIRVLGRNYGAAGTVKNYVSVSTELEDQSSPVQDQASTSVSADADTIQELRPTGTGRRLSYAFSRAGTDSVNEMNEIRGMEVFFEQGGAY